jgi:hypothetical protein
VVRRVKVETGEISLGDDFQPRIAGGLLQLGQVGPVDPGLMGEVLLRDALGVPEAVQIGGE